MPALSVQRTRVVTLDVADNDHMRLQREVLRPPGRPTFGPSATHGQGFTAIHPRRLRTSSSGCSWPSLRRHHFRP
jgi:hypothetical protein